MDRREFLAATTTSVILSNTSHAAPNAADRIKVGQIGTKHAHASGQIGTCRQLDSMYEVVGVVEPDKARRKQIENHESYRGLPWLAEEQLLNVPGLQAVAVETEVRDLLVTAQRCVDAGMHIHVDKPAGESLVDLLRLHRTAQAKSLTIQMGYMYRYNPAFRFLYEAVGKGWLGDIFEIHGVMSKSVGDMTRRKLAEYQGGSMFELGCHLIDPLLNILGTPENVMSFNRQTRPDSDVLFDNTFAVFEYPRATASIRSALVEVDGFRRRQFVVCGDEGTIAIRPLEPPVLELTLARPTGGRKKGSHIIELPRVAGRYHGAWMEFAQAIRGEKDFSFSHDHDLAVQRSILVASGYATWNETKRAT